MRQCRDVIVQHRSAALLDGVCDTCVLALSPGKGKLAKQRAADQLVDERVPGLSSALRLQQLHTGSFLDDIEQRVSLTPATASRRSSGKLRPMTAAAARTLRETSPSLESRRVMTRRTPSGTSMSPEARLARH